MDTNLQLLPLLSPGSVDIELLTEMLREYCRMKCHQVLLPATWKTLEGCEGAEETLDQLCSALTGLKTSWEELLTSTPAVQLLNHQQRASLLHVLHVSLSISHPPTLSSALLTVCDHSLKIWKQRCSGDVFMDTDDSSPSSDGFWERFVSLMSVMRDLGCLSFFMDHSVAQVVQGEVKSVVTERCSQEFECVMIEELVESLQESIAHWISHIYCGEEIKSHWKSQIQYLAHKCFAELRIIELFDILVEFPDSESALCDLRTSLTKVNLRSLLISSLKNVFENRLLHPGANTADIITQYISAIKGLRILEPSGVVLEQVCDPVRTYLRTREDTVRCIVASLIDDSSNELADELVVGEPVLVDLDEESDGEEGDYDSWQPDPIDADPSKTSKSRQTSDIISLLVNIYGSREMFVNEYRNLLADRLLQTTGYNTSREVRNLELLKLRFGESNLHFCEVMIKDIADSKRINTYIHTKLSQDNQQEEVEQGSLDVPEINAFILSHVFWPNFREEKLQLPDSVQKQFDRYREHYKGLKGMRTLEWKPHLGLVEVDLVLEDRELSFTVSPFRASIIHRFGEKNKWTVDALSTVLEAQPSAVRRHLGYWVSQGVLKEKPTDTFSVVERQQKGTTTGGQEVEDEEESATVSAEDQRESEFQVYWAYIVGMLKSLGKMKLDKIHTTLRMFAMQGDGSKECSQAELKSFLDRKVKEQLLCVSGGDYHLP